MERKTFRGKLTLKAADGGDEGAFTAVFATLGVKDLDGDVTIPGGRPTWATRSSSAAACCRAGRWSS